MPTVTRLPLEAHPFSFANVPSQMDGSPVFLIKVHNDATKLLRDFLGSDDCALLPIEMEGPYGATPQLDEYPTVILFAGKLLQGVPLTVRGNRDSLCNVDHAFAPRL